MIKVYYFAYLREAIGLAEENFTFSGKTVAELKEMLTKKHHIHSLETVMVSVNETFVDNETILADGDEVAIIPPVSGG